MNKKIYIMTVVWLFVAIRVSGQAEVKKAETEAGVTAEIPVTGDYYDESQDTVKIMLPQLLPDRILEQEKVYRENKPEQTPSSPSNRTIDNTLYVGTTAGSADVTATGAASYQIPMEIPEGRAGLKPSVSIGYNSQTGNGVVGYGWNLSASSAITRCGKTFYYDNAADAPQLTGTDNIMLDGQRLLLISGQNLTNGAKYRLEYDPSTDIEYKVVGSYYGFSVRTKDGTKKEYGSTVSSNIQVSGGGTLFWLLSKVTDKNGNTMTYTYDVITNNGEFYLSKIEYAANRSILFSYEARSDTQKGYLAGAVVNCNKRLENISTYIGQVKIKEYEFVYDSDGLYSKLTEVIEKGQNDAQYNPIAINYEGSETYADEYITYLSEDRQGAKPLFADFNGDGKMDFLSYPEKTSYTTLDSATLFLAYTLYGDVSFYKKCRIPMQFSGAVFQGFILADLNGDGKMDAINISRA
ncbi:MAG: hypothetical protein LBK58_10185, partial [Prevotellaceae bacterium]|nr:hypothetical protein [Prevotellaceae bacterium]